MCFFSDIFVLITILWLMYSWNLGIKFWTFHFFARNLLLKIERKGWVSCCWFFFPFSLKKMVQITWCKDYRWAVRRFAQYKSPQLFRATCHQGAAGGVGSSVLGVLTAEGSGLRLITGTGTLILPGPTRAWYYQTPDISAPIYGLINWWISVRLRNYISCPE